MATYDDFKKKAKEALDTIADVSVEAYKIAEEKAKIIAKRAKLNTEITREKASIRRTKIRIGDTYYEMRKDGPDEALKEFCENITASLDTIAAKQRELEELKKGFAAYEEDIEDFGKAQDEPAQENHAPQENNEHHNDENHNNEHHNNEHHNNEHHDY